MSSSTGVNGIVLHGRLADEFGEILPVIASSIAKALTILEANFPNRFLRSIREGEYFVWYERDGKTIPVEDQDALFLSVSCSQLHIMPNITGSSRGKGGMMALLGAALIGAAIVFSGGLAAPTISAAISGLQGTMWGTIAQFGVGMVISGITQMLSPQPSQEDDKEQTQSTLYNGSVNRITEGGAIPVLYGAPYVNSTVISAGLDIERTAGAYSSFEASQGGGSTP